MSEKVLFENKAPATQTVAAIVELLNFLGRASNLVPEAVELPGMVLVLSNKRDVFYTTTATSCSCPSAVYRPGQRCKHQRKYFPENGIKELSIAETLDQADENLSRMPFRYRKMVRAAREEAEAESLELIPKVPFKPFLE